MEEHPLFKSSRERARADTTHFYHFSIWFFWGVEVLLTTVGGFVGFLLLPDNAGEFAPFLYPAIGGIAGAFLGFVSIYLFFLFKAPYRQRDEAREFVKQQRIPSDSEVNDTIRLLEAETLVLKREEEERSFSFAQVFLAIADQLSIGVSLIRFEGQIRKGLGIDERERWYFPYEYEGITHLIGVLDQNALVERRNEEYQHMVAEYDQVLTVLNPPKHLAKGTETKYYLSSLGKKVVIQLRRQSTAHMEGSESQEELKSTLSVEINKAFHSAGKRMRIDGQTGLVDFIVNVALTLKTTKPDMHLAWIRLCMGGEQIEPFDSIPPLKDNISHTEESYELKFKVPRDTFLKGRYSTPTAIRPGSEEPKAQIYVKAGGHDWYSEMRAITASSPD